MLGSEATARLLWSAIIFGALGTLIGLRYRAPVLILATFAAVAWGIAHAWAAQGTIGRAVLDTALLAAIVNAAYLVALALRVLRAGTCR